MTVQWYRRFQLTAAEAGGTLGVSIDNLSTSYLKLRFEIMKSLLKEPNEAKFEVYNLTPDRAKKFENEYTDVTFNAGYEGDMQLLFVGNTQYVSTYRDKTEWITEIICGDGDKAFRNKIVNQTFHAGTTDETIVDYCVRQFGNIRKGVVQLASSGSLGGRTFTKTVQQTLDEIATSNGCNWSIQDGVLQIVRTDMMLDVDTAIVLAPDTGLLEAAERTDKGIRARALLNPNIRVNTAIKLDNSAFKTRTRNRKSITKEQRGRPVDLAADGIYKVFKVVHSGDTRANDWMTEVLCVGLGQPIPTTSADKSQGVPIEGAGA